MTTPVTVCGVDVDLEGRPVLRQADLGVSRGEFVALLGANGSGKSTLVRATIGLVPLKAGSVELFGSALADFREWHRIGYMPQRSGAVNGVPATVREIVTSGRLSRRPRIGRRTKADRIAVDEAIERVGLADRQKSPVTELSGGQQQRVLIARALASEPELLVMDEPTAGVDYEHTVILTEVLGNLAAEGTAILVVAHELGPMLPLVDRAVLVRRGVNAYAGPIDHMPRAHDLEHTHVHSGQPLRPAPLTSEGPWS